MSARPESRGIFIVEKKSRPILMISHLLIGLGCCAVEVNVSTRTAVAEQRLAGIRNGDDAGHRRKSLLQAAAELHGFRVVVACENRIDSEEQNIFRAETGIDIAKILQRANQKAGADGNDDRERHLRNDERIAKAQRACRQKSSASTRDFPSMRDSHRRARNGELEPIRKECR